MITYPMKIVKIVNANSPTISFYAKYCDSFHEKLMGLMFKKSIDPGFGIIMTESRESRMNTSIHMLFMNFNITVLWLDKNYIIVDKVLAHKWNLAYFPAKPAQYTIELHETRYDDFNIGDKLLLENVK